MNENGQTCLLAFDSATGPCSVAVVMDGRVAAYEEMHTPVMQSARLMPMAQAALEAAGVSYRQITGIACTVGPGSFTGIRVALAAARGVGLAAGVPVLGYSSFSVLAQGVEGCVLALLNAGKGECYYQYFLNGAAAGEPSLDTLEAALDAAPQLPVTVCGNVEAGREGFVQHSRTHPRADALGLLAVSGHKALPPSPFYIRPPDAKLPAPRKRAAE